MQENTHFLRDVLTNPTAGPWYGVGREQLSHRAGGAQEKQALTDSPDATAVVPREGCVPTGVMCVWFSD